MSAEMRGRQMPPLPQITEWLESMLHAADAAALPERTHPSVTVLVKLPVWSWLTPKIDVGRKGSTANGGVVTLPVRVDWHGKSVLALSPGDEVKLPWRLIGMGYDMAGEATVGISGDMKIVAVCTPAGALSPEGEVFASAARYARATRAVVASGRDARWSLISSLEGYTRHRLNTANYAIAHELGGEDNAGFTSVLDDIAVDELVNQMLFGDKADSAAIRMVDRALRPEQFRAVDPLRYMAVSIRARSEEAIRRKIGDPKVGTKVRRVWRASGARTVDELIEAYRTAYPKDALAHKRAIAALTAGPELTAHQSVFRDEITEARRAS